MQAANTVANSAFAAPAEELQWLHVDDACIVVVKPAGLLSVPGRGADRADCAWSRVRAVHADALVVHRLDMATSGLLLLARGASAQRFLSVLFAQRRVHKRYVAVVHGLVDPAAGVIDLPLSADWPNRPRQQVDPLHGKPSLTRWRVLRHDEPRALTHLELEPVTGRSHQLRVHLQAIGHTVVGDRLYAPGALPQPATTDSNRLMLHAQALTFEHPQGAQTMAFETANPFDDGTNRPGTDLSSATSSTRSVRGAVQGSNERPAPDLLIP